MALAVIPHLEEYENLGQGSVDSLLINPGRAAALRILPHGGTHLDESVLYSCEGEQPTHGQFV